MARLRKDTNEQVRALEAATTGAAIGAAALANIDMEVLVAAIIADEEALGALATAIDGVLNP